MLKCFVQQNEITSVTLGTMRCTGFLGQCNGTGNVNLQALSLMLPIAAYYLLLLDVIDLTFSTSRDYATIPVEDVGSLMSFFQC